ncbi:MAG: hypothetical protein ABFD69_11320 [Candidatus Sumerlaeia bacterium]
MFILPMPGETSRFIRDYCGIGGVIDYQIVGLEDESDLKRATHAAAARLSIEEIARTLGSNPNWGAGAAISIDHDKKITGCRITTQDFVGSHFDLIRKKAILRGHTKNHLNDFFYTDDEETPNNAFGGPTMSAGYSYAFFEPPYRLGGSNEQKESLFRGINRQLFDEFEKPMMIYSWSTDWSSYFDAGNEWWGSFLWTAHVIGTKQIVVVAAAASD